MSLLIQSDHVARDVVIGLVAAAAVAEAAATYFGQARDGTRRPGASIAEALLLTRRRDAAQAADRGTKQVLVVAVLAGLVAAVAIAKVPTLRTGANTWWTIGIGALVMLCGVALRSWAVFTLGHYFRREIAVEADQRVITTGPYRWVRHPAYAGNLLTYAGLGLVLGSWVSAAVVMAAAFVGQIPRIKVEERTLERTFGSAYVDYERVTARLIPGVW